MLKGPIRRRKSGSTSKFDGVHREWSRMGESGPERSLLQDPDETGETLMENRKESENQPGLAETT